MSKREENMHHFQHIILYYFKKDKNTTESQKKKIVQVYVQGAVTDQMCQKGVTKFWSFVLEISCWMMLYGRVDQFKLIAIKLRH